MGAFDFVAGDDFRESLEADYQELLRALDNGSWKSATVLAGSIVEAILIDYLISINYATKDPLTLDLAEATRACKSEGVLSPTAADLTSVIRSYRNLIHPGRSVRLGEKTDEDSARIAKSLVDMVMRDVARNKYLKHGYTADDIVRKIRSDPNSRSVIRQLVEDAVDVELGRLLGGALERLYLEDTETAAIVRFSFRAAFARASDSVKKQTAKRFIKQLKEADATSLHQYESVFFHADQLAHLDAQDAFLVKQHLLEALGSRPSEELLASMDGIGSFLSPGEARNLAARLARAFQLSHDPPWLDDVILRFGTDEVAAMDEVTRSAFFSAARAEIQRLRMYENRNTKFAAGQLRNIIGEPETDDLEDLPF